MESAVIEVVCVSHSSTHQQHRPTQASVSHPRQPSLRILHSAPSTRSSTTMRLSSTTTALALAFAVGTLLNQAALADSGNQGYVRRRVDCRMSEWPENYDDCDTSGFKTKTRVILEEPKYGGSPCPASVFKTKCTRNECWMHAWSDWVCDANTGMQQRTRAIAPGGLQDKKKCNKNMQRKACDPIPCELNTLEEDVDNPWGPCRRKRGVWIKSKALGIKSPAQYGGVCFEEDHPVRKVTAVCEPVDCVVTPVDEDQGNWDPCVETSPNVWTQTKTLGITPALYGGQPCSDASRIATASCAQDCKWSATEFDPWTVCNANNVKYHPFKITQETQYGGQPCPPIEQRAEQAPCDVDCQLSQWVEGACVRDPVTNAFSKTSERSIVTPPLGNGLPCGATTVSVPCTPGPIDCTINANSVRAKVSGALAYNPSLYGGAPWPVNECDWMGECNPVTPAAAKTACTNVLAMLPPIKMGYRFATQSQGGNMLFWQCAQTCATTPGCTGVSRNKNTGFCYFLTSGNIQTVADPAYNLAFMGSR